MQWSLQQIPDLTGKKAIVTGGNIGLGWQSSLVLASKGAHVTIACRSYVKGHEAMKKILAIYPHAQLDVLELNLIDIESIKSFSESYGRFHKQLDILLNNAGVVNLEQLQRTKQGHEMHMATNHLAHFALTGLLMPQIKASDNARVVTVSSAGYKAGEIRFDDLNWHQRPYNRIKSYGDSKLANLLFSLELENYFRRHNISAQSLSAHPGLTATERQQSIGIGGTLAHYLASSVEKGVRYQLYAATCPQAQSNTLYGPKYGIWGAVSGNQKVFDKLDQQLAKQLWQESEKITGVSYSA